MRWSLKAAGRRAAVVAMWGMAGAAQAQVTSVLGIAGEMDKVLTIQPIQVCDDNGKHCADKSAMYRDFLIQTYAQAKIAVAVLPWKTVNNSTYLTALNAGGDPPSPQPFVLPTEGASSAKKTLNAWFINDLVDAPNWTTYGRVGTIGGNGLVIDTQSVLFDTLDDGTVRPRKDTFAHEIGHNLGLEHDQFGAGGADNLMTSGAGRTVPASKLTQEQITKAGASEYVAASPKISFKQEVVTTEQGSFISLVGHVDELPEGVHLRKLSIDLIDANLLAPTENTGIGRPWEWIMGYGFTSSSRPSQDHAIVLSGYPYEQTLLPQCSDDFLIATISCYGENTQAYFPTGDPNWPVTPGFMSTNGKPEIDIRFGAAGSDGDFAKGDEFTISLLLFSHHVHEETTDLIDWPRDFDNANITLEYDFGLVTQGGFDTADAAWNSRKVTAIGTADYDVTPFGAVYGPGEGPTVGTPADIDSVFRGPRTVAEPTTWALLLIGGWLVAPVRRRRAAATGCADRPLAFGFPPTAQCAVS